jgi:hypothetical protein
MLAVNDVGEPGAREPHARFDGRELETERLVRVTEVGQPDGKPRASRLRDLPPKPRHRASSRPYTALGDAFEGIEIDSSPGNPYGIPAQAHSVLAIDFVDEPGHPTRAALDRVLSFLHERLHTYLTQDRPPSFRGRSVSISGCACQPVTP